MKKAVALMLAISMAFALCACCLSHDWQEATCTEPKTCLKCGKTEGEALGHKWEEATCTKPKTCSVCGVTEGKALGHKAGEATCTEPSICSVCGETVKNALGHKWVDATCTEPKTCSVCGATEGTALGHQWKDATVRTPKTCERCGETEGEPLVLFYWNEPVELVGGYTACFYDDGNGNYRFEVTNPNWNSQMIYAELQNSTFEEYGIGRDMYKWIKHILDDYSSSSKKGNIVYYSLNGYGHNNTVYFSYSGNSGILGLELSSKRDMEALYKGTIGVR